MKQRLKSKIYEDVELQKSFRKILNAFDKDPDREGLQDTPRRYLKFLNEFCNPEPFKFTTFDSEGYDEMIIEKNIPFYSLCEHHTCPFFGVGHIAYIPNEKIVGISKLARTLEWYARGFQNQERITKQICERIMKELNPLGVAVLIEAQHTCMSMRGIKKHDTWTVTSALRGVFKEDLACRTEFLNLAKR